MTFAPIKGQCPVCHRDGGLNLDPLMSFSESKVVAELRAENASLKEVISLSEDSRLMDEYLKLERANARQAERIAELEGKEFDWARANAKCTDTIAAQAAVIVMAKTEMENAKETMGWDEVPYLLHVKLDALFDAINALPEVADQWQPIETAPKDGTRIIVCSEQGNVWCDVKWEKRPRAGERWTSFIGPLRFAPTHWMPLPKPPAVSEKKASE